MRWLVERGLLVEIVDLGTRPMFRSPPDRFGGPTATSGAGGEEACDLGHVTGRGGGAGTDGQL